MMISIGDAIRQITANSGWQSKLIEQRISKDWPEIVGNIFAKHTNHIQLDRGVLYITTSTPILKHEIQISKEQLIGKINRHYQHEVVKNIVVK